MHRVKFVDLHVIDDSETQVVVDVLKSGQFILGDYGRAFAESWAVACGTTYCVPTSSGSSALTAALKMANSPRGAKVLVPALSFAATTLSVCEAGCTPEYCDVTPAGLMDLERALEITEKKYVWGAMPVHLYGQVLDVTLLTQHSGIHFIIEDACQAHGAFYGLVGDAAAFSFYPAKNLGAVGDAGALVTNNPVLARAVSMYTSYGDPPGEKYTHEILGSNQRMDEVQAAILLYRLRASKLMKGNTIRTMHAHSYKQAGILTFASHTPTSYHQYPILVDSPAAFCSAMSEKGVDTARHYPYILPDKVPSGALDDYPNARRIAEHAVSLPISPHLSYTDICYVAEMLVSVAELDGNMWRVKSANS
jgi:dTDP-4-amino-4,6-dideoxygalactose transaminase